MNCYRQKIFGILKMQNWIRIIDFFSSGIKSIVIINLRAIFLGGNPLTFLLDIICIRLEHSVTLTFSCEILMKNKTVL